VLCVERFLGKQLLHAAWRLSGRSLGVCFPTWLAGLLTVSCWQRDYNKKEVEHEKPAKEPPPGDANSGGSTPPSDTTTTPPSNTTATPTPTAEITQVNPKAFNAFDIWRSGSGSETLHYPQGYDVEAGSAPSDGVFFVESPAFWKDHADWGKQKFIAVPTEGAKVVNDVLEYPAQNGKQLRLKFTSGDPSKWSRHNEAVQHCKQLGLRLPTAREFFDFCAVDVVEPNYGPNYQRNKYPESARCADSPIWSASLGGVTRFYAWFFNGGHVDFDYRSILYPGNVWCVGSP
jgi:hypothetical protein